MIARIADVRAWFAERLDEAVVPDDVKPYALSVLARPPMRELQSPSVVLSLAQSRSFVEKQTIGDRIFWLSSFVQGYEHQSVSESCARAAYEACSAMLLGRVRVYAILAENLPEISCRINETLRAQRYLPSRRVRA